MTGDIGDEAPEDIEEWFKLLFPFERDISYADFHLDYLNWLAGVEKGKRPNPYVAIWSRGAIKSTLGEQGVIYLGAHKKRRYGWYVCANQTRADDHVSSIGKLLVTPQVERHYPLLSERSVNKYGSSEGWRRNRLFTKQGLIVDALGLDVKARGAKLGDRRPDFIVFDDIDDKTDTPEATKKKVATITQDIIPAGSNDVALLFLQNLIIETGVFGQLRGKDIDWLTDRIVNGPVPAIEGFAYQTVELEDKNYHFITAGVPTWQGQPLEVLQGKLNDVGPNAFRQEYLHEPQELKGGYYDEIAFRHIAYSELPDLVKIEVWVDPATTASDNSDSHAICAGGIDASYNIVYNLFNVEQVLSPEDSLSIAIWLALDLGAEAIGIETDQGGNTWGSVYREAWRNVRTKILEGDLPMPRFGAEYVGSPDRKPITLKSATAGAIGSKTHRQNQQLAEYQAGKIRHVIGYEMDRAAAVELGVEHWRNTHTILEKALRRFPIKPLDLADASDWCRRSLSIKPRGPVSASPNIQAGQQTV